ncbi:MAG: PQQ-binding-like beta-propeller repeat protein, partial [Caldisericota bacterium]|nr:PQQ-binding-like beta-propeller repeat protein [Caldisericota bacterium]
MIKNLEKAVVYIIALITTITVFTFIPPIKGVSGIFIGPAWPMFMNNPQHTGRTDYPGCDSPEVKWTFEVGNPISSTPAIDQDGNLFLLTTSGTLFAVSPNGEEMWRFETGTGIPAASFWVTPLIATDKDFWGPGEEPEYFIYFGAANKFFALKKDGTLKWSSSLLGQIQGSPNLCKSGIIQGTTAGAFTLKRTDGTVDKFSTVSEPVLPPAVSPETSFGEWGNIYLAVAHLLGCLDPDGGYLWDFNVGYPGKAYSPSIGPDGTVYFRSEEKLFALNPNGTEKWSVDFKGTAIPAVGKDGTVYLGSTDKLFCAFDPDTGEILWKFTEGASLYSAATIDGNGVIYFGSADGKLYALNPDGSKKWEFNAGSTVAAPPSIGKDGTIYFGTASGILYALGESGPTPTTSPTPTTPPSPPLSFPDVPSSYWAYSEIMKLVEEG